MLVLDTNTISYYFRGDAQVVPRLQALRPVDLGTHDVLIAAAALRHQATLVTRNVREFARVPGLSWVNWHAVG